MTRLVTVFTLTLTLGACSARTGQPVVRPQGVPAAPAQEAVATPTTAPTPAPVQAAPQGTPAVQSPAGSASGSPVTPVSAATATKPKYIPRGSVILTIFNNVNEATCTIVKDGEAWCSDVAENQWCPEILTNRSRSAREVSYTAICVDPAGESLGTWDKTITLQEYRPGRSKTESETLFIGNGLRKPRRR